MTPKNRLYQKRGRYYADFRDYAPEGGGLEALIPATARPRRATEDPTEAMRILAVRLDTLEGIRLGKTEAKALSPLLREYAVYHLKAKARAVRESTVERDELSLRHAVEFFGEETRLRDITVAGLTEFLDFRSQQPGSRTGSTLAAQTQRHELTALSSLFKRAVAEGAVSQNPAAFMPDKPRVEREEPEYLEMHEAARLIRAAFAQDSEPHNRAVPFLGPLTATLLYTGCRRHEAFGLEVRDVDFTNRLVHVRANAWRPLKRGHHRTVPLWPKLRRVLRVYLKTHPTGEGLLFPNEKGRMLSDTRESLRVAVAAAKIEKRVTTTTLRHTYAAVRLQTLDHGEPISPYTVMRELGHGSLGMIERHYGHLLHVRHRRPSVEYKDDVLEIRGVKGA